MDGKVTDSSKMDQIQSYDYRKNEKRRWLLLGTGILVSIVLFIIDIIAGERWIPLSKIMAAVFYPGTMRITDLVIINDIRIPRACMAFLAGGACESVYIGLIFCSRIWSICCYYNRTILNSCDWYLSYSFCIIFIDGSSLLYDFSFWKIF